MSCSASFASSAPITSRKRVVGFCAGLNPAAAMAVALEVTANTTDDELLGSVAKIALRNGHAGEAFEALLRAHEQDPTDHEWLVAMVGMDPERAVATLRATVERYTGESRDEVVGALGNALPWSAICAASIASEPPLTR